MTVPNLNNKILGVHLSRFGELFAIESWITNIMIFEESSLNNVISKRLSLLQRHKIKEQQRRKTPIAPASFQVFSRKYPGLVLSQ